METYQNLLKYFNVYTYYDDILESKNMNYVLMDDIHNAIIKVGISMDKPLNHYIIKSKQFAINRVNETGRRHNILKENAKNLISKEFEFDDISEYGFNELELDMVYELLSGTPRYKSSVPRRQYHKVRESIKRKIMSSL